MIVMIRFCEVKMVMNILRFVRLNICCMYVNLFGYFFYLFCVLYEIYSLCVILLFFVIISKLV